jgi:hypothetical protein
VTAITFIRDISHDAAPTSLTGKPETLPLSAFKVDRIGFRLQIQERVLRVISEGKT